MLAKGDKVVMENCMEAKFHEGVVWNVTYEEFTRKGYGQRPVVFLEGFSGSFTTDYLRKVDPSEETIVCIMCDTQVLVDSNGYISGTKLGTYWCKECADKEENRQKVLKEVKQMKITHTVFKNEDLNSLLEKDALIKFPFEYVQAAYIQQRKKEDKYIVINTDENPRMIEEIIKVMKQFGMWG
ncbi:hypothetical protein [Lysinibacillus sphaericus]|uniref:hypothetical protein n=1 Tax=Lysinibacillus sphaericus TaxID=1421 RepID=UPI000B2A1140|nr:hypothetical protein [Lysinibacillus sphaericus]